MLLQMRTFFFVVLLLSANGLSASTQPYLQEMAMDRNVAAAPLRIAMVGSELGCASDAAKRLGSLRIGICNVGHALLRLGHLVEFYTYSNLNVMFKEGKNIGKVWDVVVAYTARVTNIRTALCFQGSCPPIFFVKPNPSPIVNEGIPIFDSMVNMQSALLTGFLPRTSMHLIPIMKLLEVPSLYWQKYTNVSFSDLSSDPLYSMIPHHAVHNKPFTAERIARVCYHGSNTHLMVTDEAQELLQDLAFLQHNSPAFLQNSIEILILTDQIQAVTAKLHGFNITANVVLYTTIDDAYSRLVDCDVGLVPNMLTPPYRNSTEFYGAGLVYKYKPSSNGGRAFVFAQLGVPIVGNAEFEFLEMLAISGVEKNDVLVYSTPRAWHNQLVYLLSSPHKRLEISSKLRSYAEKNLHVMAEVQKLEKIMRAHLTLH